MESKYPELALCGSKTECARTDTVFFPISQRRHGFPYLRIMCLKSWFWEIFVTVLFLYKGVFISCKTVAVGVDDIKDGQAVQGDQGDVNQDGIQDHTSQVLGLCFSRNHRKPVCRDVA